MPNPAGSLAKASVVLLSFLLSAMRPGQRSFIARQVVAERFHKRTIVLADFFHTALLAWKNKQYNILLNGEQDLLRRLAPFSPKVVIDVGANVGDWSRTACQALSEANIHAFEIVPATAQVLRKNVAEFATRIKVNELGLGSEEREITFYSSPESSTAASTILDAIRTSAAAHGIQTIDQAIGSITTGDAYLRANSLDVVDLLKIDVEGAEPSVLMGFADAFRANKINLVQFEYGEINLSTRYFLQDFYSFFEEHGFVVGKLFPEGVAFGPYRIKDEDFVGPNFVACHTNKPALMEAIRLNR